MAGESVEDLRASLRSELMVGLAEGGWVVDDVGESFAGTALVGSFRLALTDDFSVTAFLEYEAGGEPPRPPLTVRADFGVSYERSYRLWTVMGDYPQLSDLRFGGAELGSGKGEDIEVRVRSARDVAVAADYLVSVAGRAVVAAGCYCGVDALLAGVHSSQDERYQIETVPLVLAAAGRGEEARAAMAGYRALERSYAHSVDYRRFVFLLTAWLDSGADLPAMPTAFASEHSSERAFEPPPDFGTRSEPPSWAASWQESKDRRQKRRAAADAVRARKAGKSRDELRAIYQHELEARGLTVNPHAVELGIDAIEADTRAAKRKVGWRALGDVIGGLGAMVAQLKAVGQPSPGWMEPPLEACFEASCAFDEWITVDVDASAGLICERALSAAVHSPWHDDEVGFETWLTWTDELPTERSVLIAHLGTTAVATLDPEQTRRYKPDMDAALAKGQLPALEAKLTRRTGLPAAYQLKLAAPAAEHHEPGSVG